MVKLVALWNLREGVSPQEAEVQYLGSHVQLARKVPGLKKYTIARSRGRNPRFYRMAELYFENMDTLKAGLSSPAGKAMANDQDFLRRVKDLAVVFFEEEEVTPLAGTSKR